jgi:hypothetical protein
MFIWWYKTVTQVPVGVKGKTKASSFNDEKLHYVSIERNHFFPLCKQMNVPSTKLQAELTLIHSHIHQLKIFIIQYGRKEPLSCLVHF